MLADLGGVIINTDRIVSVEHIHSGVRGSPQCQVRFSDGSSQILPMPRSDLRSMTGTVIPALPGYRVLRALYPYPRTDDAVPTYRFEPVLAFRILGDGKDTVAPITPEGQLTDEDDDWVLVDPTDACFVPGVERYETIAEFKRTVAGDPTAPRPGHPNGAV